MRWPAILTFAGALGLSPLACSKPPRGASSAQSSAPQPTRPQKTETKLTESDAKAQVARLFAEKFGARDPQVFVHGLFPDPGTHPHLLRFEAFKTGPGAGRGGGNAPGLRGVIDTRSGTVTADPKAALAVTLKALGFPKGPDEAETAAEVIASIDGDGAVGTTAMVDAWEVEAVQQDPTSPEAKRVLAPRIVTVDGVKALEYYAESPKDALRGPTRVFLTAAGEAKRMRQGRDGVWTAADGF